MLTKRVRKVSQKERSRLLLFFITQISLLFQSKQNTFQYENWWKRNSLLTCNNDSIPTYTKGQRLYWLNFASLKADHISLSMLKFGNHTVPSWINYFNYFPFVLNTYRSLVQTGVKKSLTILIWLYLDFNIILSNFQFKSLVMIISVASAKSNPLKLWCCTQ